MIKAIAVPAFQDNYIWLIHNPELNTVAIVDPGDARPVIDYIENSGFTPVTLLITHHHADHVGGLARLKKKYDLPVYGPANENIPGIDHALQGGDEIAPDGLDSNFRILDVPGHTLGHIAYYGDEKLFIGDTLFMSGCGRLFEGTPEQMHQTLNKIVNLPDNTEVYCTHEYTLANLRFAITVEPDNEDILSRMNSCKEKRNANLPTVPGTISTEKLTNPFLRVHVPAVISAAEKYAGHSLSDEVDVFACIRKWKDNF